MSSQGQFIAGLKVVLLIGLAALCLFETALRHHSLGGISLAFVMADTLFTRADMQWLFYSYFAVWCAGFMALDFEWKDILLTGLLVNATIKFAANYDLAASSADALVCLGGITAGKGARLLLKAEDRMKQAEEPGGASLAIFLLGLVVLLAFASWWHLDMAFNYYHGPRWMGLWDNPNIYGMLMGAGTLLAIGIFTASLKAKVQSPRSAAASADCAEGRRFFRFFNRRKSAESADEKLSEPQARRYSGFPNSNVKTIFLWGAIFMLGTGLVMSYSRGAWLGTAAGLAYLAWSYGKLKWQYVILGAGVLALASGMFWGRTPEEAPWFVKRADLGRPSAQNRVTAWRAGLAMMRDHPWGVGWNHAVKLYGEKYHPPAGGPGALTTNSYLMLGTELGIPALLCFGGYIGMCFRSPRSKVQSLKSEAQSPELEVQSPKSKAQSLKMEDGPALDFGHGTLALGLQPLDATKAACRAGALVLVVAFWFDGGLFTLPTAAVFWVLLELGSAKEEGGRRNEARS